MKKIFALTIFLVLSAVNVCSALSIEEFNLGNVKLNMTYDEVVAMYGQPTSRLRGYSQLIHDVIIYGDSVEIAFMNGKVRHVVTTANNGWKTPSGIYVGMSIDKVIKIYGTDYTTYTRSADKIPDWMKKSDKPYYDYKWYGTRYTWSRVADIYGYEPGDINFYVSVVVNGEKVTGIVIGQRTPES